jgi:hypothetical protein
VSSIRQTQYMVLCAADCLLRGYICAGGMRSLLALVEMSSLIVVSFATAMTNDEISITASHYALFTFLFTLFNGSVGCVPAFPK